jgi:hypothetical protein
VSVACVMLKTLDADGTTRATASSLGTGKTYCCLDATMEGSLRGLRSIIERDRSEMADAFLRIIDGMLARQC